MPTSCPGRGSCALRVQGGRPQSRACRAGTTPQIEIPIPETGVLKSLEALADRYAAAGVRASGPAIVDPPTALSPARRLGRERRRCLAAARLRDVGKIGVPPAILAKAGRRTRRGGRIMRDHVRVGVELLSALPETR